MKILLSSATGSPDPQHRNTATPQHRNTATPQLLLFVLFYLFNAFDMVGQVFCEDHVLENPVITTNSANGQTAYVGCSQVSYCFSYASPTLVEEDSGNVVFTFVLTDIGGNPVPVDLVSPGIFTQTTQDTFIGEVNGLPNNTLSQYCLSFAIDPSFSPDTTKYIQAIVTAAHDSCTNVLALEFPNRFPTSPGAVIVDERLSDVAVGTSPLGTGTMYNPSLSQQFGQLVQIEERLIIDLPFYTLAQGSEIMMGPDATIVIEDGSTLSVIQGVTVLACSDMWARIRIEDGGTLLIDGTTGINDILIRDAMQAVQVEEGGTLYVDGAIFRNNHTGVHKEWNTGDADVVFVANSTFEVDAEGLLAPMTGATDAQGLFINHQTSSPVLLTNNTYRNLLLGVNAQQSNVVSTGDTFEDITGAGIFMGSDALHSLTQSGGTFDNVRVGIEGRNINIVSKDNTMNTVETGYRLYNGRARSFDIADNEINAQDFGVLMFNWNAFGTASIADNEISIAAPVKPDAAGIRMAGLPHVTGEVLSGNKIVIQGAEKGIDLQDCIRIFATGNEITKVDDGQFWDGIGVEGGSYVFPYCNNILGGNIGGTQRGISVSQALHVRPSCNSVDNTLTGIRFDGANLSASVRSNHFHAHNNGLEIGASGILGEQRFRGNQWLGSLNGDGLVHFSNDPDVARLSQFIVNTSEGSEYGTSAVPTDLLANDDAQLNLKCTDLNFGCDTPPDPNDLDDFTETDCEIALGTIEPEEFMEAQQWTAKRQLYRRLMEVEDLGTVSECLEEFFDEASGTTVGQFELLRKQMHDLFLPEPEDLAAFDGFHADWKTLSDSLLVVMGLLETAEEPEKTALEAQRDELLEDLSALSASHSNLETGFREVWMSDAQNLVSENASISVTETWEQNQKDYNTVLLEMTAIDQVGPDSLQTILLLGIAYQCPYAGGEAVYQARALLGEGYAYDDEELCAPAQPLVKNQGAAIPDFGVFPNPTKGFLTVTLKEKANVDGFVLVSDILGRPVQSQPIGEGVQEFYLFTGEMPAGTFTLTVEIGGDRYSKIISVIK